MLQEAVAHAHVRTHTHTQTANKVTHDGCYDATYSLYKINKIKQNK